MLLRKVCVLRQIAWEEPVRPIDGDCGDDGGLLTESAPDHLNSLLRLTREV